MSLTHCRFYEAKYPEIDELVMVNVKQIADMGAYVKLLEYDDIDGMVLLSELSRRRIRSVQKLIRVGRNEVVVVLRVDKEKGYIDLSKRRVSPEDIVRCEERYNKSRTVHSILRHVAEKTEIPLETLYQSIGWPLNKRYGHALDAFRLSITNPDVFLDVTPPSEAAMDELIAYIKNRLTPQPTKVRADVEVTCFKYEGIDAIKTALRMAENQVQAAAPRPLGQQHPPAGAAGAAGEDAAAAAAAAAALEEQTEIKVKLVAPPLYVLSCHTIDKNHGIALLEEAIRAMTANIRGAGGDCVVKMAPKAVDKTDDAELQALMEKRERENQEVSGDEDSGDADEGLELA